MLTHTGQYEHARPLLEQFLKGAAVDAGAARAKFATRLLDITSQLPGLVEAVHMGEVESGDSGPENEKAPKGPAVAERWLFSCVRAFVCGSLCEV